jgi:hypothetical protein
MIAFRSVLGQRTNNRADASSLGGDPPRGGDRQTDHRSHRLVGLVILTLIGILSLPTTPDGFLRGKRVKEEPHGG